MDQLPIYAEFVDDDMVELAPGLSMPVSAVVTVPDWEGFKITLRVKLVDGRYRCHEMHLLRRGEEITGEALRSVPVARFLQLGITTIAPMPSPPAALAEGGPTKETLAWVAKIYRLSHAIGVPPTQQIAQEFNLKPSTAGRWVSRAREARFLEPAEKAGKAGG
jgi:hypothetical protein